MYGLDAFILPPPLSILVSLLLIAGCDGIGKVIWTRLGMHQVSMEWGRFQCPLIGAAFLSVILYPIALLGFADKEVFSFIGGLLIIGSSVHLYLVLRAYATRSHAVIGLLKKAWSHSYSGKLLCALIVVYGIFSLGPITNADSLDYHTGIALHILNSGGMPVTPEWFPSRLAGSGEVLIALGFSVGAEQFGSLLQFTALLSVVSIILFVSPCFPGTGVGSDAPGWRIFLGITVLSAPVMIFLVGSVKPQLAPAAMTTLALTLCLLYLVDSVDKNRIVTIYSLICVLILVATQQKFNYFLGGGVVGLAAAYQMYQLKLFQQALVISGIAFLCILVPPTIWKSITFGGNLFESIFTPLPGGWYATSDFENYLRNYRDSPIPFPLSLIIPAGFGTLTTVIGVGVFLPLLIRTRYGRQQLVVVLSLLVFALAFLLGPPTSRSYLEPFFWLLIILALQGPPDIYRRLGRWIRPPIFMQAMLVLAFISYGGTYAVVAAISKENREQVMRIMANGYTLMSWVDEAVPKDAVILSQHRSIALSSRKTLSTKWMKHTRLDPKRSTPYLERIKEEKVTHLLILGKDYKSNYFYRFFLHCLGDGIIGPGEVTVATRNPMNRGATGKAWLIEFHADRLPSCTGA